MDKKEIAYIQKAYEPVLRDVVAQLYVEQRGERWFICYSDGDRYSDQPYKTCSAAKAALTRIKRDETHTQSYLALAKSIMKG